MWLATSHTVGCLETVSALVTHQHPSQLHEEAFVPHSVEDRNGQLPQMKRLCLFIAHLAAVKEPDAVHHGHEHFALVPMPEATCVLELLVAEEL